MVWDAVGDHRHVISKRMLVGTIRLKFVRS